MATGGESSARVAGGKSGGNFREKILVPEDIEMKNFVNPWIIFFFSSFYVRN